MAQKAKRWLRFKTHHGSTNSFIIRPDEGGYAGSLVGLGFISRRIVSGSNDKYHITTRGIRWIGAA